MKLTLKRINDTAFSIFSAASKNITPAFVLAYVAAGAFHRDSKWVAAVEGYGTIADTLHIKNRSITASFADTATGTIAVSLCAEQPVFFGNTGTSVTIASGLSEYNYKKAFSAILNLMVSAADAADTITKSVANVKRVAKALNNPAIFK
jgi:hypothetical protein